MTADPFGNEDLDRFDQFLDAYTRSADRAAELRATRDHPSLADEFRLLALYDTLVKLRIPDEVAGVELLGPVGRGGMALVYEGVEKLVGRSVAVKLCPVAGDPVGRERFLTECRTLAGLHQTSIVPILTAGREGVWLYCVMPLIDGASLAELVRRAREAAANVLPPLTGLVARASSDAVNEWRDDRLVYAGPVYIRSAVEAMAQAAEAVAYAHQQGVWHLDLKPANLMLEETGHCWVIDFGLAREAEATPAQTGGLTEVYAAPEQRRGEADARTDVWGLGATLYELLTLRRPAPDLVSPRTLAPEVPRDLHAICLKALARRPEDRYPSSAAFAADLRRWLDGEEPAARPWPVQVRLWELARRHRAWTATVAASLLGIVVALFLVWRGQEARSRQVTAEADAARSRAWALLEQARDGLTQPMPGRRAEVRRLLLAAARERRAAVPGDDDPAFGLRLRSLYAEGLGLLDFIRPDDPVVLGRAPFQGWPTDIHPDGTMLAIGTARRPVVWSRNGPKPVLADEDIAGPRSRVIYGPTGRHLVEIRPLAAGGGLRVWSADAERLLGAPAINGVLAIGFDSKETRLWAASSDGRVESWAIPSLTPAGRLLLKDRTSGSTVAAFAPGATLVAFGDAAGSVNAYDATGAAVVRLLVPGGRRVDGLAWSPDGRRLAVGTVDGTAHVFRRDGSPIYRVGVSPFGVSHLTFSPDGRWLTGHYRDHGSQVWDGHTGSLVLRAPSQVWGFARDGRTYAAADTDKVGFGEVVPPGAVDRYEGHLAALEQLAWAPEGGRLATLSSDFEARIWNVARPGVAETVLAAPPADGLWAEQSAIALGPGSRQFAYASSGRDHARAVVWDVPSGRELAAWDLPGGFETLAPARPASFLLVREETLRDTRNVATVMRVLEVGKPLPSGHVIRQPEPPDRRTFINHWLLPDGRHYLWAGPREPAVGRRIELFETDSGRRLWSIEPPTETNDGSPGCLLTQDLRTLFVEDGSPVGYRYDLPPRGEPEQVPATMLAISADRRWMLTLERDERGMPRSAVLSRTGEGPWVAFRLRDSLRPAGGRYLFSPDGRHLAWGSTSGSVAVIDLSGLEEELRRFEQQIAANE